MNNFLYSGKHWLYLLIPVSIIYSIIILFRQFLYKKNILKSTKFSVPVIVVGNITTGGTGKTPLVIWLSEFLQKLGYKPGIVSRGYKGKAEKYPIAVTLKSEAKIVGDEPLLIAKRTGRPVVVDPNRVNAINYLLENFSCDIVISDDGLQHYAMKRDIEIAVIDGQRGLGNGWCLPVGPLRESSKRLGQVDFVINNGGKNNQYSMDLQLEQVINLKNPNKKILISDLVGKPIHAVAAIGNPQRFFQALRSHNLNIIEHVFPDHYYFSAKDLQFADEALVIMTEKDAVKCRQIEHLKDDPRLWVVPVTAQLDPALAEQIVEKCRGRSPA